MTALIGRFECTLDPKNRIFAPARYRDHLTAESGRHFILSIGLDGNLFLFLPSQWERLLSQSQELFQFKNKTKQRAVKRYLFSNAHEAPLDEQGRILIPPSLKQYAGLKRDLIVLGTGSKAELWDKARLRARERSARKVFARMSADLDL